MLLFSFASACASSPGGLASDDGVSSRVTRTNDCWPVMPLRLDALEHGRDWEPVCSLRADGTILNQRGALGVLRDDAFRIGAPDNKTAILEGRCRERKAELRTPLAPAILARVEYDRQDTFRELGGDHTTIRVGDDGFVDMQVRGRARFGPPGTGGGVVRVVGDVNAGRRTAALLMFIAAGIGAGR